MTIDVEVKILGGKELHKALSQLPIAVEKRIAQKGLRAGAKVIIKDAKSRVPVDEGVLKKEIKTKAGPKSRGNVIIQIFTSTKAWYSHLIEFGTSNMRARPFLRPAVDNNHAEILKAMGDKMGKEIIKEAAK